MIREERVDSLIRYLRNENDGYASIREPVNYDEKRRLLRSLMNVRWPGEASEEFLARQDEFLTEEAEEKGIVDYADIPVIGDIYTCIGIKNMDRISPLERGYYQTSCGCYRQCRQQPDAWMFCALPRLY